MTKSQAAAEEWVAERNTNKIFHADRSTHVYAKEAYLAGVSWVIEEARRQKTNMTTGHGDSDDFVLLSKLEAINDIT